MANQDFASLSDNSMDTSYYSSEENLSAINDDTDADIKDKEKFSLRLMFQNEQPPEKINGKEFRVFIDCLKRMNFLDFHDCRQLARSNEDYFGFCVFAIEPFKTNEIEIESGDIFLANTDVNGKRFVVKTNNTAHGQTFRKIFNDASLRTKHVFMGFAQHNNWLIGRSGTFNSKMFTNLLPLTDEEKIKEGLFIFRTLIYGSIIMFKQFGFPTLSPYGSAMGLCLFLIQAKVGTKTQQEALPVTDISIEYSDVFMTQMFIGMDIHPTILAILYQNEIRAKVFDETLSLLLDELSLKKKLTQNRMIFTRFRVIS